MMTFKELKDKLLTCEKAIKCLQNGTYKDMSKEDIQARQTKLNSIKENILKEMKLLKEAVEFDNEKDAAEFADNNPETPVKIVKEAFSIEETKAIAKKVGKAVAMALKTVGDAITSMKAIRVEENSFEIKVLYKNGSSDEFSFYISEDKLHLVDFTFDKELVDVGVKPSGEPIVHVDVLSNALVNHFKEVKVDETKGAPKGHYFTKSGNLVKGRLTKDARERGARLSDPKDKQRSKVPPVTQYNEGYIGDQPLSALPKMGTADMNLWHVVKLIDAGILQDSEKDKALKALDPSRPLEEGEGDDHHYIKVPRAEFKKAEAIIAKNIDGNNVKMDYVDNDGAGNAIIYFMFRDGDIASGEANSFMHDTVMDLEAYGIMVPDHSAEMDEGDGMTTKIKPSEGDPTNMAYTDKVNEGMDLEEFEREYLSTQYGSSLADDYPGTKKYSIQSLFNSFKELRKKKNYDFEEFFELVDNGKIKRHSASKLLKIKVEEAELSKGEKKKLKDMSKSLKKSSKGHAGQAKYIDKLVKEGRGDMDMIKDIIRDRANESGFEEKEEAAEVIAGIAEEYKLNLKMIQNYMDSDGPVNPFAMNEADLVSISDDQYKHIKGIIDILKSGEMPQDVGYRKEAIKSLLRLLRNPGDVNEGTDLYDKKGLHFKRFAGKGGPALQITVPGMTTMSPNFIQIPGSRLGEFASALMQAIRVFDDMSRQTPVDEAIGDDLPKGNHSVATLQKVHGMIVDKMKEVAKIYKEKGGDHMYQGGSEPGKHTVIDILKDLNNKKKKVEDALDKKVSGIGRNQQLAETPEQEDAVYELRDIVDQVEELGNQARQIVRQNFPNEMSRMEGYGVFNLAYSNNRYDTTLGSEVDRLEGGDYDDLDDDDYPMEAMSNKDEENA